VASRVRTVSAAALASAFLLLCVAPGLMLLDFDGDTRSLIENRDLAPPPGLPNGPDELASWAERFDAFVADHFGARQKLVAAYNYLHVRVGVSPIDRALVGRDGWLFLEQTFLADANRGALPFTDEALDTLVRSFEHRARYLEEQGVGFVVMPAPDKNSIFPDYLPAYIEFVGPSRLDQFRAAIADARFASVDVTARLRAARAAGEEVYFQTDSHWNSRGAWFAYRALMDTLRETGYGGGVVLDASDVEFIRLGDYHATDIVRNLLGLDGWIRERHGIRARVLDDAEISAVRGSDGQPYDYPYSPPPGLEQKVIRRAPPRDGSRVLVYRDSYGNAMIPFLAHTFDEVVYTRPPKTMGFDPADIERYRPDVVIYEFVERALFYPPDDSLLAAALEAGHAPGKQEISDASERR
jgi:hypothetical protein